jgi:hypothetical protein
VADTSSADFFREIKLNLLKKLAAAARIAVVGIVAVEKLGITVLAFRFCLLVVFSKERFYFCIVEFNFFVYVLFHNKKAPLLFFGIVRRLAILS